MLIAPAKRLAPEILDEIKADLSCLILFKSMAFEQIDALCRSCAYKIQNIIVVLDADLQKHHILLHEAQGELKITISKHVSVCDESRVCAQEMRAKQRELGQIEFQVQSLEEQTAQLQKGLKKEKKRIKKAFKRRGTRGLCRELVKVKSEKTQLQEIVDRKASLIQSISEQQSKIEAKKIEAVDIQHQITLLDQRIKDVGCKITALQCAIADLKEAIHSYRFLKIDTEGISDLMEIINESDINSLIIKIEKINLTKMRGLLCQ